MITTLGFSDTWQWAVMKGVAKNAEKRKDGLIHGGSDIFDYADY